MSFSLLASNILGLCCITSFLLLLWNSCKRSTVRLDDISEPPEDILARRSVNRYLDALDVITAEDTIDGLPMNEDMFWMKAQRRRWVIIALQFAIIALDALLLFKPFATFSSPSSATWIHIGDEICAIYILLLITRWMCRRMIQDPLQIHVIGLTGVFSAVKLVSVLSTEPPSSKEKCVYWTTLVLSASIFIITVTSKRGPDLWSPYGTIQLQNSNWRKDVQHANVSRSVSESLWGSLVFAHTHPVLALHKLAATFEVVDLPTLPANMRATVNFSRISEAIFQQDILLKKWKPTARSGWRLGSQLFRLNAKAFGLQFLLAVLTAVTYYAPAIFLQVFIAHLESDKERKYMQAGWIYVLGLFMTSVLSVLISQQLWSVSMTELEVKLRLQLNSILYGKTLLRKNMSSTTSSSSHGPRLENSSDEEDFSSKAQVMTLMTTDADRVADFPWHICALIDSPIEIGVALYILHGFLGISSIIGLASLLLFYPISHLTGAYLVRNQEKLMKTRDERVSLMNEILGGIRMIKFMACEKVFRQRVQHVRDRELGHQRTTFIIEALWTTLWNASPIVVILVTFWHFTVIREQDLTPSIAFPSIIVFSSLKFVLNALPEALVKIMQSLVSLRRIEIYLDSAELDFPITDQEPSTKIAFKDCGVTWSDALIKPHSGSSSRFSLVDLNIEFPLGKLTLVCGRVGSGKSLLLLALLGEAEITSGIMRCPRTPPDLLQHSGIENLTDEKWLVPGTCAYVPQVPWLRNASIRENILYYLPYNVARYRKTLEACALINDLKMLQYGDESEIGDQGVNLSGGQKARVSLARAVYSRASIMFLDDILSAVDAHTAKHMFHECLKGDLMSRRTIILVSHHISLCAPDAGHIVRLDRGRIQFQGPPDEFLHSHSRTESTATLVSEIDAEQEGCPNTVPAVADEFLKDDAASEASVADSTSSTVALDVDVTNNISKTPKEDSAEERATGSIGNDIWMAYVLACGGSWYWACLVVVLLAAAVGPILENAWLRHWSGKSIQHSRPDSGRPVTYYIAVYAAISAVGLFTSTTRWLVLFSGSLDASKRLYERLFDKILFSKMRFHDTTSRGRLLNRFGKDFEVIDSQISSDLGHTVRLALSAMATITVIGVIAGFPFQIGVVILGFSYVSASKAYEQTCRELRRLEAVSRSPLYSLYGESISGASVLRACGACAVSMRQMLQHLDSNISPYYWIWAINRWISTRFSLLSSCIVGFTAVVCLLTPSIDAALAGFTLAFASTINEDILYAVRYFVQLEQSMVAMERIEEYSSLESEGPEFCNVSPPQDWPSKGEIRCEKLCIRYAESLPNVLHDLTFQVKAGEKVPRTPQTFKSITLNEEPVIMSGTLRSALDMFGEYSDAEIYGALHRVQLIPTDELQDRVVSMPMYETVHHNKFSNLDERISEGGENFSTGEKQLLCLARALLKRAKILVMDEATASVDYSTDELIGRAIREVFKDSTVITIAHRLQTVMDHDRVAILDEGKLVELDSPSQLMLKPDSYFFKLSSRLIGVSRT